MKRIIPLFGLLLPISVAAGEPALTIYNQDFAVVRDTFELNLKPGVNAVRFVGTASYVEPSSVILRDPTAKHGFQILEQNFRADVVSQDLLLLLNEGKTIEFEVVTQEGGRPKREIIKGCWIVRVSSSWLGT